MPKYDFECDFGHTYEDTILFADLPPLEQAVDCPFCGADAFRKLSTGTSILNNKVMSPPSKRMKPSHFGKL